VVLTVRPVDEPRCVRPRCGGGWPDRGPAATRPGSCWTPR